MTNTLFHNTISASLPPYEARTFHQSLQAANKAWQDFVYAEDQHAGNGNLNALSVFTTFSRFIHELIQDHQLRGRILWHFERQLLQTGTTPQETHL